MTAFPLVSHREQSELGADSKRACQKQSASVLRAVRAAGSVAEIAAIVSEGRSRMTAIFMDCTDDMIGLWHAVRRPATRRWTINMSPGQPADVPALIAGLQHRDRRPHAISMRSCSGAAPILRHIVFLGTGASSFIDLEAAERHGDRGAHDQGLWRHDGGRAHDRRWRWRRRARWRGWTARCAPGRGGRSRGCRCWARRWASSGWAGSGKEVARMATGVGDGGDGLEPVPPRWRGADASLDEVLEAVGHLVRVPGAERGDAGVPRCGEAAADEAGRDLRQHGAGGHRG